MGYILWFLISTIIFSIALALRFLYMGSKKDVKENHTKIEKYDVLASSFAILAIILMITVSTLASFL